MYGFLECNECHKQLASVDAVIPIELHVKVIHARNEIHAQADGIVVDTMGMVFNPDDALVSCPNCDRKGRLPDLFTARIRCYSCNDFVENIENAWCKYTDRPYCLTCMENELLLACRDCNNKDGCGLYDALQDKKNPRRKYVPKKKKVSDVIKPQRRQQIDEIRMNKIRMDFINDDE